MDMDAARCTTVRAGKTQTESGGHRRASFGGAIFYGLGHHDLMLTLEPTRTPRQWVFTGIHAASIAAMAWGGRRRRAGELRARYGDNIADHKQKAADRMLVVEVMMLLKEIELPAWFLPAMTAHELIQLGHNLFPAFLNGCRCIGAYLFVDLDGHQRALLGALHEQNKEVLRALRDIQTSIQNGGGAGPARPMSVGDAMRNLEAELEGKDIKHPSEVNIFSDGFPSDKKKSNANLYLMIGGYIVLAASSPATASSAYPRRSRFPSRRRGAKASVVAAGGASGCHAAVTASWGCIVRLAHPWAQRRPPASILHWSSSSGRVAFPAHPLRVLRGVHPARAGLKRTRAVRH